MELGITGAMLKILSEEDLQDELQMKSKIHRKVLLSEIQKIIDQELHIHLPIECKKTQIKEQDNKLLNSLFLNDDQIEFVISLLPPILKINLIYETKKQTFSGSEFHKICDGKGPTLIIAKAKTEYIFGGYTGISWGTGGFDATDPKNKYRSFIFSVTHQSAHKYKEGREQYHSRGYGPIFGSGDDLKITGDGKNCYANLGYTYLLPEGLQSGSAEARNYLAGQKTFDMENYEVFAIEIKY